MTLPTAMLGRAATAAAGTGLVATAVAAGWSGRAGALGAAVATAAVVAFFVTGALPLLWTPAQGAALAVLLLNYTLRVAGLAALAVVAGRTPAFDGRAFGFTVIATALAWTAVEVAMVTRPQGVGRGGAPAMPEGVVGGD